MQEILMSCLILFKSEMLNTVISCLIGAFVTWVFSRHYYKKAGDELQKEAQNLKTQTQLILVALEQSGLVELQRDNNEVVGFKNWHIRTKGWDSSSFGTPSIGHKP